MTAYVCPRCDGTGNDPEDATPGEYGGYIVEPPAPAPCIICYRLARYSLTTGYPRLSDEPHAVPVCMACCCRIEWIECPTGGWWRHLIHPVDEHDAKPVTLDDIAKCTTGNPISCVDRCCDWRTPGF